MQTFSFQKQYHELMDGRRKQLFQESISGVIHARDCTYPYYAWAFHVCSTHFQPRF